MFNISNMKNAVSLSCNKGMMTVAKHSPEILAGLGTVGVIASTVLACKATTKLSTIMEETSESVNKVKEVASNPVYAEKYSAEDAQKDMTIIYVQSGVKILKVYLPAIALGTISLACLLGSNNILRNRNAALSAAYLTVDKSFKEYRKRVVGNKDKDRYDIASSL